MSNDKDLEGVDHEELLKVIRSRNKPQKENGSSTALTKEKNIAASDIPTLLKALKAKQKVIYGVDDRKDMYEVSEKKFLVDADSVVALFKEDKVLDNSNGTSTLITESFGISHNLCKESNVAFFDQPTGAFCTGFLVAPDIIATAGHCVTTSNVSSIKFLFGFREAIKGKPETVINNIEIYTGTEVIDIKNTPDAADWALIRLDRRVENHPVVKIRRSGKIPDGQSVHVIGHPSGLPAKFADGALVRENTQNEYFVANLDTFGGNSGSPVFNSDTHEVEGILVRGEADFETRGTCLIPLVCPTTGCQGEHCTRTTEFGHLLTKEDNPG
ncbi:trypsin-like serine peptidase [Noviherbaspirillum suwonense]|uniref:Trypsin-like peptidase domain-containing protein n=1 Tax=Noviherbaspirillum suwonense TaxID=1224511 RepID=A0ABY1PZN6_9BURK|nr:serine protease [Noviherbaspirillum suwonense]SMP54369.1 Trypsin-like peptidase domain-containing protein [Noviherbaspirillum suwonense]